MLVAHQRLECRLGISICHNAKTVGHTVDVRKVRNDLIDIEDVSVGQTALSHGLKIVGNNESRSARELGCIRQHCSLTRRHFDRLVVVDKGTYPSFVLGEANQTGRMVRKSIVATVYLGDDHADHLSFSAGNCRPAVHDGAIKIDMCT